jgi:imidazolonepropionase-like amidohydrolase
VERFLAAYRGGVRVAAGSDNGSPAAPHPDIATELEIFVRLGLTPFEALEAATVDAARLLDLAGEIGTIEPGKRADLVILRDDPLRDISAVRRVDGVVQDGALYGPAAASRAADLRPTAGPRYAESPAAPPH